MNQTPVFTQGVLIGANSIGITGDTGWGGDGGTAPTHQVVICDATAQTIANCTFTLNSAFVSTSGSFLNVHVGDTIAAAGVPPGTTVLSKNGLTTLVMSANATATNTENGVFQTQGLRVEEIRGFCLGTMVAGLVNLFTFDGTTYRLFDQFVIPAYALAQTSLPPQFKPIYSNLIVPPGWQLAATQTVTQAAGGLITVQCFGGAY